MFKVGDKVILKEDFGSFDEIEHREASRIFGELSGKVLTVKSISGKYLSFYLVTHPGDFNINVLGKRLIKLRGQDE